MLKDVWMTSLTNETLALLPVIEMLFYTIIFDFGGLDAAIYFYICKSLWIFLTSSSHVSCCGSSSRRTFSLNVSLDTQLCLLLQRGGFEITAGLGGCLSISQPVIYTMCSAAVLVTPPVTASLEIREMSWVFVCSKDHHQKLFSPPWHSHQNSHVCIFRDMWNMYTWFPTFTLQNFSREKGVHSLVSKFAQRKRQKGSKFLPFPFNTV